MNRYIKSSSTLDALSRYTPYEFITRYIPNGGFVIQAHDAALTYKFVSEGYAAIMGYTVEEFLEVSRNTVNTIVDCMGHEEEIDAFNANAEVGDEYVMQYKLRCKDGSWKLVEDHGRLVQNADGSQEFWSVVIDIDAQERLKEAEAALEKVRRMTEEQETQIEEISALNSELEERQAQLEESTAEQESQIQEIQELNRALVDSRDKLSHDFNIISSLSEFFAGLFYIDLSTYRYVEINPTEVQTVKQIAGASGDAERTFQAICANAIVDEYRQAFAEFTDMTTLADRLRNRKAVSLQFIGTTQGWVEGSFIAAERDADGECKFALWVIRSVNEQKEKDLLIQRKLEAHVKEITTLNDELEERQALLEESTAEQESQLEEIASINTDLERKSSMLEQQLGIVGSLANTFQALYIVDLTDYSFVELGQSRAFVESVIGRKGDAKASFAAMCNYLVTPEQKAEMEAFTDLTTLRERLAGKHFISHQYCGMNGIWSEGFFVTVSRDEDGLLTNVLWGVRTIDEFKQKEIKTAEELTRAKEAAEAANNAKTTFLNNMSHDIRTPMNAILGFAKLIERDIDHPDKIAVSLSKIKNSGHYLLSIINNVLDMARIESGKVSLNPDFVDLRDPEANIIGVFEEELNKKGLTATFDLDIEHRYVLVDIAKTNQIVVNLISNAIKYTPAGGRIVMKMQELPCVKPGYATYCWTIKDTGIGMSKEFRETIFESFTREQNTTHSKIVGTGLGMAIVKRLVDFLGGTIEVESEPGKGTTFSVWLDHQLVEKPEDYIRSQTAHIPENFDFRGKRILLAEDNDLNAEIAEAILSDEGFFIERVEDGVSCIEKLNTVAAGYYDVILMDIQMPYLDGYGATEKIRQLTDARKANIPILAMTANAFEEDKRKALAVGMDGFCTKPIDIEQLNKELARIFQ